MLANLGTFIGVLCFLVAALVILPRDSQRECGIGNSVWLNRHERYRDQRQQSATRRTPRDKPRTPINAPKTGAAAAAAKC